MSRFDNVFEYDSNLNGAGLKVGVVMCRFNLPVCEGLLSSCIAELKRLGVADADMTIATVPGALEVALVLQNMAASGRYDALVAIGAVIRGETYHFELVANESGAATTRVGLDYHLPIANAIITTENLEQAIARQTEKGRDAARVAVEMARLMAQLAPQDTND